MSFDNAHEKEQRKKKKDTHLQTDIIFSLVPTCHGWNAKGYAYC